MQTSEASSSIRSETIALASAGRPIALIIEHPETQKFVQILYDSKDGFLVDLPSQTLDDNELARAKAALAPLGVEFESWEVSKARDGMPAQIQSGFNFTTGPNPEDAANAAEIIARQVFHWDEGVRLNFEKIDI